MSGLAHKNSSTGGGDVGGVAALDRAFAILVAFSPADHGLTLATLAARTGLYKSTILRLAQSLVQHQFLVRHDDGRFQVGPAPLALGAIYQRSVTQAEIVLPVLRELASLADDGASFYIRVGERRMCLYRIDSGHTIKDHVREGDVLPLARGSGGRVLSAFSGAAGRLYELIRRQGYFISLGDRDPETSGISAPVFGPGQVLIGALTVAGPAFRMTAARLKKLPAPLLDAAARTSLALGCDAMFLATVNTAAQKHQPAKNKVALTRPKKRLQ